MHIHGEEIRLDPEQDQIEIAEDDWSICRDEYLMRHIPTQVTFRVEMDEDARKAGGGTLFNFAARPVHVCPGHALPPPSMMTELGRAAILLFVYGSGFLNPDRCQDGEKPTCGPDLNLN